MLTRTRPFLSRPSVNLLGIVVESFYFVLACVGLSFGQDRTCRINTRAYPDRVVKVTAVRHLQSEHFPEDLEVEVQNISSQPIYYISFHLTFPNKNILWYADYGQRRLSDLKQLAGPEDSPLKPGEKYILKLQGIDLESYRYKVADGTMLGGATQKLELVFQEISFGDGTGVRAGEDARDSQGDCHSQGSAR